MLGSEETSTLHGRLFQNNEKCLSSTGFSKTKVTVPGWEVIWPNSVQQGTVIWRLGYTIISAPNWNSKGLGFMGKAYSETYVSLWPYKKQKITSYSDLIFLARYPFWTHSFFFTHQPSNMSLTQYFPLTRIDGFLQ